MHKVRFIFFVSTILFLVASVSATEPIQFGGVFDSIDEYSSGNSLDVSFYDEISDSSQGIVIEDFEIELETDDFEDFSYSQTDLSFAYEGDDYSATSFVAVENQFFTTSDGDLIEGHLSIWWYDGSGTTYTYQSAGESQITEQMRAVYLFNGIKRDTDKKVSHLETLLSDLEESLHDLEVFVSNILGSGGETPSSSYWSYLDSRTQEDIACGFGEDNSLSLFKMSDLGMSCDLSVVNDRARCSCEEVRGTCELDNSLYCYSWNLARDDLTLELANLATEDLTLERIEIEGCDVYERTSVLREGRDRRFRIDCSEEFEEGVIEISYYADDGTLELSRGSISLLS